MARPLGITILGGLVLLAAAVLFLLALASFVVGLAFLLPFTSTGTTLLLNGLLYLVVAIVLAISGSGLLGMRPWAWGLAILAALVTLVYVGYNSYHLSQMGEAVPLQAVLELLLVGAVFVYLLSVSRSFRRPRIM